MSRYLKSRVFALQILVAQTVLILVISASALSISYPIAISIFLGGVINLTANAWFTLVAFRHQLGASPQKVLAGFYTAELGKFFITALLFFFAFKQIGFLKEPAYAMTLILAYVIVQAMAWIYPLMRNR